MKTIRILAVIFFLVFLILTAIGVYLIIKDSCSFANEIQKICK